eukprot:754827-Hanusia_phi.AAC.8
MLSYGPHASSCGPHIPISLGIFSSFLPPVLIRSSSEQQPTTRSRRLIAKLFSNVILTRTKAKRLARRFGRVVCLEVRDHTELDQIMTARLNNAYETLKDPVKRRDFEESFFGIRTYVVPFLASLLIVSMQPDKLLTDKHYQALATKVGPRLPP